MNSPRISSLWLIPVISLLGCIGCRLDWWWWWWWWCHVGFLSFSLRRTLLDLFLLLSRSFYRRLGSSLLLRSVAVDDNFWVLQDVGRLVCRRSAFQETEWLVGDSKSQTWTREPVLAYVSSITQRTNEVLTHR